VGGAAGLVLFGPILVIGVVVAFLLFNVVVRMNLKTFLILLLVCFAVFVLLSCALPLLAIGILKLQGLV
jgi:hypothetical protein